MSARGLRTNLTGGAFVMPAASIIVVFSFVSMAVSLYVSFHNWDILIPVHPYVGLGNFREVLFGKDTVFWIALRNTVEYVAMLVPAVLVTSFILALAARRAPFGQAFFKTAFFLPSITPVVVVSLIWMWLYSYNGPINAGLAAMLWPVNAFTGIFGAAPIRPPNWLADPSTAMSAIVLMSAWQASGYYSVIFLAGLSDIPREFYEAAEVDGAGRLRCLWHITIPLLRNTFVFVSVMLIIGGFQVFTQVYIITRGGPAQATEVLTSAIFKRAFQSYGGLGASCAMAWLLFAAVFVFVLIYMRLVRSRQIYD